MVMKIVLLGDSMTEGAGKDCKYLREYLHVKNPSTNFKLFNYGVGGTRVGYGVWRLTHNYEFNGEKYCPLVKLDPDVVIVESFAYNNGSDGSYHGGLDHFRAMHQSIIDTLRSETKAQIIYCITIAPDRERFLESVPNFIYTPASVRHQMAIDREVYLKEAVKIAESNQLPVVNAYAETLKLAKKGIPLSTFIDPGDWIHPNAEGHKLIARMMVETLTKLKSIK
jgi:hypothetical protein